MIASTLKFKIQQYIGRESVILTLLLLVYHLMCWRESNIADTRILFVIFIGLFLLWQPLWEKHTRVNPPRFILLLAVIVIISYWLILESVLLAGIALTGLIGSRFLSNPENRGLYLIALLILVLDLSIGAVPNLFVDISIKPTFQSTINALLLLPIIGLLLFPPQTRQRQSESQIDLLHGLMASMLISLVLLATVFGSLFYGLEYLDALLLIFFMTATLSLGISWLWNPSVGFTGLGVLWNRYSLTIGGPFEQWIKTLTTLIEEPYLGPLEMLHSACDNLTDNEWLQGLIWRIDKQELISGQLEGYREDYELQKNCSITLYFKSNPGRALLQHTQLLLRMAWQFYLAKQMQERMRMQEHFATIHHTGARLTHDIKNILQSIRTSLSIVEGSHLQDDPAHRLLQRNLIQINQRLETSLDKLRAPELSTQIKLTHAREWLDSLRQRSADLRIIIIDGLLDNIEIPAELFDSVEENLRNNAFNKADCEQFTIKLSSRGDSVELQVCDDGSPIPDEILHDLFLKPVTSGTSMGIGLYQCGIMAKAFGYQLELAKNEPGQICFRLF